MGLALDSDEDLLQWLTRYDSRPTLLPEWPRDATGIALAMVRENGEALVVLSRAELQVLANPANGGLGRLFFRIPKTILVASGRCPGLLLTSWSSDN